MLRHLSKKVANFLHEYHADQFASLALPLLPSDRSDIDIHSMLGPLEIALLLRRPNLQQAMRDMGHFSLFGTLEIGHSGYPGFQRVQCWPFPELRYYGSNREDFVFIRPPGALSRCETHVCVHCLFINIMNGPNVETLIFLVPASNHFMF